VTPSAASTVALLATFALAALWAQAPPAQPTTSPRAVVAEYDGIIHPIAAEFFDEVVARADTSGATVAVFVLRTPGGLLDSTRTIVSRMIGARTPVVIYVGPSGSRAASAGFIIALAADVAVMAPGTHIGAAHPVSAGGGGDDSREGETMAKKAAEDAAAYARTLAAARGRNESLAAEAVINSRAFTEREALAATPPLIDFVASSVTDLLAQLDGRTVRRFNGGTVTLETTGIAIEQAEMTRRQQFLSAIAHPQIAALLLTLGVLGLTIELWTPGAILPGVAGGVCLLLAFFAFQILPVNTIGILLIAFGIGLLVLELKIPSFGALGIGGTIALLVGAVMITSEVPGLPVGYEFVVPTVVAVAAVFLFLGRLAMNSQRLRPVTGAEALVGKLGSAMTALAPGGYGQVSVHGEIWRATTNEPIASGQQIRVAALEGLTLLVAPVGPSTREGE
jgi:membrane-bound serine protease (ClpP class)